MKLQYKWDVYLLTGWFNHPGVRIVNFQRHFLLKNKLTMDDCESLLRFKTIDGSQFVRVQPFICAQLPKLSKILWNSDISDIFDIADKLTLSNLDVNGSKYRMLTADELKEHHKTKKIHKHAMCSSALMQINYDANLKSNQWHVCK